MMVERKNRTAANFTEGNEGNKEMSEDKVVDKVARGRGEGSGPLGELALPSSKLRRSAMFAGGHVSARE